MLLVGCLGCAYKLVRLVQVHGFCESSLGQSAEKWGLAYIRR